MLCLVSYVLIGSRPFDSWGGGGVNDSRFEAFAHLDSIPETAE